MGRPASRTLSKRGCMDDRPRQEPATLAASGKRRENGGREQEGLGGTACPVVVAFSIVRYLKGKESL